MNQWTESLRQRLPTNLVLMLIQTLWICLPCNWTLQCNHKTDLKQPIICRWEMLCVRDSLLILTNRMSRHWFYWIWSVNFAIFPLRIAAGRGVCLCVLNFGRNKWSFLPPESVFKHFLLFLILFKWLYLYVFLNPNIFEYSQNILQHFDFDFCLGFVWIL